MTGDESTTIKRLDRIETKIDKMTESLISLARAEERIAAIEEDRSSQRKREVWMDEQVASVKTNVNQLTLKLEQNTQTFSIITKLFWILIVAITGAVATQVLT